MEAPVDAGEWTLFREMVRTYPVRTLIFTFGLPLVALGQLINGFVNQAHVGIVLAFVVLAVGYSVSLTRYQLAVYRRRRLTDQYPTPDR